MGESSEEEELAAIKQNIDSGRKGLFIKLRRDLLEKKQRLLKKRLHRRLKVNCSAHNTFRCV